MFEVIPKGRDKTAKVGYQFLSWVLRENSKKIKRVVVKKLMDFYLYGIPIGS
jgi:hypothetical protein